MKHAFRLNRKDAVRVVTASSLNKIPQTGKWRLNYEVHTTKTTCGCCSRCTWGIRQRACHLVLVRSGRRGRRGTDRGCSYDRSGPRQCDCGGWCHGNQYFPCRLWFYGFYVVLPSQSELDSRLCQQ